METLAQIARLIASFTLTSIWGALGIASAAITPPPDAALLQRVSRAWSRQVLRVCDVTWSVHHHGPVPTEAPAVFLVNHQSHADVPPLFLALPGDLRWVAKRELLWVPFFGLAVWLSGSVMIDRGNRTRALRSMARAAKRVADGHRVLIFPEGTRSLDGRLARFKKGGFVLAEQAGVPVIPVGIRGSRAVLRPGDWRLHPGHIEVHVGSPMRATEHADLTAFMAAVREAIRDLSGQALADPVRLE